ncbi:hypothetical protein B566_EDAN008791 [Ephemera danica]|nr:hypothetical protein B566_EDAN008791 [Ephemera danica]
MSPPLNFPLDLIVKAAQTFNMLFNDEVKAELLARNHGDPRKTEIVEELSRPGYEILNAIPGPRFIKSHFPLSLLPANLLDTCKVIYVARNPKDVAVSFYHQNRPWTPFWKHLEEGWERRNHPNLKFLFYEDMIKDQANVIRDVARFIGKSMSEEQVNQLIEHLDIANFRHNPAVNFDQANEIGMLKEGVQTFVRKGKTGGWREEFTPELNARADKWIEENLKNTDLRFPSI